jgi:uncharacterized membrane protein
MREFHGMHGGPGEFGFWHGGPGIFGLGLSALFLLLLLGLLGLLIWSVARAVTGRSHNRPAVSPAVASAGAGGTVSAVELLRQRYARGEIDGDTFQVMLAHLRASGSPTGYGAADEDEPWQNV